MDLVKENWTENDILNFHQWSLKLKGDDYDCKWEKRIVNTELECFARTSAKAKDCVKQIKKGNYISFLDLVDIKTHFDSIVSAYLINLIKDFEEYKKQLDKFVLTIDNWASADVLKFEKHSGENLYNLSLEYLKSEKTFVRRVGLDIWFELIKRECYIDKVFDVLDKLNSEQEYYVNMCGAWLLAECMIKNRDKTLAYFENNKTNSFVINKAVSKCRDGFRISEEDKQYLLKFKIKTQNLHKK